MNKVFGDWSFECNGSCGVVFDEDIVLSTLNFDFDFWKLSRADPSSATRGRKVDILVAILSLVIVEPR